MKLRLLFLSVVVVASLLAGSVNALAGAGSTFSNAGPPPPSPSPAAATPPPTASQTFSQPAPHITAPVTETSAPPASAPNPPAPVRTSGDSHQAENGGGQHDHNQAGHDPQRAYPPQNTATSQEQDAEVVPDSSDNSSYPAPSTDDDSDIDDCTSVPSSTQSPAVHRSHYTMDDLLLGPDPSDSSHHTMDELL